MSTLNTPQKQSFKTPLPPKPATPKVSQKEAFSFENLNSIPFGFSTSPRNTTPMKAISTDSYSKTPFRSHNSSPSHRRSSDVLTSSAPDIQRKIQEYISKLETNNEKLRADCEQNNEVIKEMEIKLNRYQKKLRKKEEKVKFLRLVMKETESQFKIVLENTNRDLEKIIQEQAIKIKEMTETLKRQQKEQTLKWESEKSDLAKNINLLEEQNSQRLNMQAEMYKKMIFELNASVVDLERRKNDAENALQGYLNEESGEDDFLKVILNMIARIGNEVDQLKGIVEKAAKEKEVSLSMILMQTSVKAVEREEWSEVAPRLQHVLLGLSSIKTVISDFYAERYGENCRIQ
jgi:chromosome segregation ATPase